jgi:transposase InsO family protein
MPEQEEVPGGLGETEGGTEDIQEGAEEEQGGAAEEQLGVQQGAGESTEEEKAPRECILRQIRRPRNVTDPKVLDEDWDTHYAQCPRWSKTWLATQNDEDWPENIRIHNDRMFWQERRCLPMALPILWVREMHESKGHVGGERIWEQLRTQIAWADTTVAREFTHKVASQCETCQACRRPHSLKAPVVYTPIPKRVMASVAIDILQLPKATYQAQTYDAVVVCVDRHSGWIVAVPAQHKRLTGPKVAKKMLESQWHLFGVPHTITSDRGSHFTSAWFNTLAAGLGIRQVYSQVYQHQSGGRAEVENQQLTGVLRKIMADESICWVEALPRALRHIHDANGEAG